MFLLFLVHVLCFQFRNFVIYDIKLILYTYEEFIIFIGMKFVLPF